MPPRADGRAAPRRSVSRRDFLRVGGLSVVGMSVAEQAARAAGAAGRRNCIFLLMTGGPSQLETFDPKPLAPAQIRGPLRAISTSVPGIELSESLPRLAERMHQFALLRSLCHRAAPIHETGLQLLQTGRLAEGGVRHPSFGAVVSRELGPRGDVSPYVVLPKPLSATGVNAYQGQQAGTLGSEFDPVPCPLDGNGAGSEAPFSAATDFDDEPDSVLRAYGEYRAGRLCLRARQLVEAGVRVVTVNLFDALVGVQTWDCHGRNTAVPTTLYDYRDTLCPQFDRAASALLDDLAQRGLLDDTLVVATGEFGRSPRINPHSGRDHWPGVWSALLAGGGVRGGQVIGASDAHAAAPACRPVDPAELHATLLQFFGLAAPPAAPGGGSPQPIVELFG